VGEPEKSHESIVWEAFPAFFVHLKFLHPPIRASSKENSMITGLFTTNSFHFTKTASTKEIKTDAVSISLDQLIETRSQLGILSISQFTFKNTILHPLAIGFEDIVNFSPSLILRNIVRNNNIHKEFISE
jgi:hypothetical protein